jgi:hypothetical protein
MPRFDQGEFKMMKWFSERVLCSAVAVFLLGLASHSVQADTRIAVLEFELKDMTLQPDIQQETERAATIKPLLQSALQKQGNYVMIDVDAEAQREANTGFGHLFAYHDVAAGLGERAGAEYVVVGRVHKPTYLFTYLMAHLVDVKTKKLVGDYVVEVKGPQKKITAKGVESLAVQITETINP